MISVYLLLDLNIKKKRMHQNFDTLSFWVIHVALGITIILNDRIPLCNTNKSLRYLLQDFSNTNKSVTFASTLGMMTIN